MNQVTVTRADRMAFLRKEIDAMSQEIKRLAAEEEADTLLPRMNQEIGKHFKAPNGNPYYDRWYYLRVVGVRDSMFRILAFSNDSSGGRFSIQEQSVVAHPDGSMQGQFKPISDDEFRSAIAPMLAMLIKECGVVELIAKASGSPQSPPVHCRRCGHDVKEHNRSVTSTHECLVSDCGCGAFQSGMAH